MTADKAENRFQDGLTTCRKVVKESAMFEELCQALRPHRSLVEKVRCLAIGSFHDEFPARYQLALLLELIDFIEDEKQRTIEVSVYDPVFTSDDLNFISDMGPNWMCSKEAPSWIGVGNSNQVLFFLPHAPLDLTEEILKTEKPELWLANNVIAHTDRYTKLQLHEKYPVISKLLNVLESSLKNDPIAKLPDDEEFKTFVSKKKKRRNRKVFIEPKIDYDSVDSHFETCKILTSFNNGLLLKEQPWINSFSDLTLHHIE